MKITILVNGMDLGIKSIPQALKKIQDIIGMDFSTFTALTYVSHQTVVNLLDHFTDSNLSKVLLDFHKLAAMDKAAKTARTKLNASIQTLTATLNVQNSSLERMQTNTSLEQGVDRDAILSELADQHSLKASAETLLDKCVYQFSSYTAEITKTLTECETELQAIQSLHSLGVCPTCHQEVKPTAEDNQRVLELIATKTKLQDALSDANRAEEEKKAEIERSRQSFLSTIQDASDQIMELQKQLAVHDWNVQQQKEQQPEYTELMLSIAENGAELHEAKAKLLIVNTVIQVIKSGRIQQNNLNNLVTTYNIFIQELLPYVSLDYLNLEAKASAGKFDFVVSNSKGPISIGSLSGGESTRVKVVALLALLKTVQTMSKNTLNILVFDEALDGLDSSASEDLARLFHHLASTDSKCIALISHGEQLADIEFTGRHTVTKNNGLSTLVTTLSY